MVSAEFIKNSLNKIKSIYPEIDYEYNYHSLSYTHFITINSRLIFESKEYIDLEENIVNEFEEKYFGEYICFKVK